MRTSIAQLTYNYIRSHPSIADCLERGLINYSALAREIDTDQGVESTDAVIVACRRYVARKRSKTLQQREKRIKNLLARSKIQVRKNMAVLTIKKTPKTWESLPQLAKEVKRENGDLYVVEGEDVFTVVISSEVIPAAKSIFDRRIISVVKEAAQLSLVFGEQIKTVSGVVAAVYRLLANNDINIREEWSCWTDLVVIIDEADVDKALEALQE
jgi:aspartokinase